MNCPDEAEPRICASADLYLAPETEADATPVMQVDIVTLFPEMFEPLRHSIVGRAVADGRLLVRYVNPRDFTTDRHRTVDDYPYGGGPGMVMKPEPLFLAVESVARPESAVILMSPAGRVFRQTIAAELARQAHLVLICGHYEGVDERVREYLVTDEISIGDYVLTGGELAAMVVVDAVARLLPGVLGHAESAGDESHSAGLLEYPQYTRPPVFRGWPVPDRLLSGHHAEIARWRRRQALEITAARRPDLMTPELLAELTDDGTKRSRRRRAKRAPASEDEQPNASPAGATLDPADHTGAGKRATWERADDVRG